MGRKQDLLIKRALLCSQNFQRIYLAFVRFSAYNTSIIRNKEACMLDFISVKEAAQKWEISERRVQKLCEDNRIDGVIRFGHSWMIPKTAQKPDDLRCRRNLIKKGERENAKTN